MGGIFIAFQGSINGMMGNEVGIFPTVIIPVFTQLCILSIILITRRELWINIDKVKDLKYGVVLLIASALLGLGIMSSLTFSIMKVGPLIAFAIVVFSQLVTSMILEHQGAFRMLHSPISGSKLIGLLLMLAGIGLFYK